MNRQRLLNRSGAAAVELAICMPFILILVVGAVELTGGLYHQHSLRAAAHECAIVAADGVGTSENVRQVATQILSQRRMSVFDIDIDVVARTANAGSVETPTVTHFDIPSAGAVTPGLEELPRGTLLRITITTNRPSTAGFGVTNTFLNAQVEATCVFVKEI